MPEDLEGVRGRVNEVRREKSKRHFVVTDQTETSAGHGHLR